jgi:uncharacterized Ntn-hydrolase superfamily protein
VVETVADAYEDDADPGAAARRLADLLERALAAGGPARAA